jgi:DUF1365 family protein
MSPSIYEGTVLHERKGEHQRRLTTRIAMPMVDIDQLEFLDALTPLWRVERAAPMTFRRRDYMGDPTRALSSVVRDTVADQGGFRPEGPIHLLAHHRTWGWCFNPIALYYCYATDGVTLQAVVADVTNTPWGERHAYVLDTRGGLRHVELEKQMHVSPFLPMDLTYQFHVAPPGDRCGFSITVVRGDEVVFRAALSLVRHDMTRRQLARALLCHPFLTHRVSLSIYLHALRLWASRVPFVPHPAPVS